MPIALDLSNGYLKL